VLEFMGGGFQAGGGQSGLDHFAASMQEVGCAVNRQAVAPWNRYAGSRRGGAGGGEQARAQPQVAAGALVALVPQHVDEQAGQHERQGPPEFDTSAQIWRLTSI
jgi:hypothetical protein